MNHVMRFNLHFLMLCLLLGVFCSTGYANNATAPVPSPYPGMVCGNADCSIRWAEELGLESLEEARDKLDAVLDNGCYTMAFYESFDKIRDTKMACTCNDLIKYVPLEYGAGSDSGIMINDWLRCLAITYLTHVSIAKKNYLSNFVLDVNAPNILPPLFGPMDGYDEPDNPRIVAGIEGKSWMEYDQELQSIMKRGRLDVAGDGYTSHLEEYGRGDFDGDEFQDMLISVAVGFGRTFYEKRLILLTKTSSEKNIIVIRTDE